MEREVGKREEGKREETETGNEEREEGENCNRDRGAEVASTSRVNCHNVFCTCSTVNTVYTHTLLFTCTTTVFCTYLP